MGKQWKQCQTLFFRASKSWQMVTAAMKLKDAYSLKGKLWPPRQHIEKQRQHFVNNGPSSQSCGLSCGHVWMWELDYKVSQAPKSVGEDSWESLELQRDPTSPSWRKSVLTIHWKDWSWSSNTLATWCEELTHWKRPWSWERLKVGEGNDRGWHG